MIGAIHRLFPAIAGVLALSARAEGTTAPSEQPGFPVDESAETYRLPEGHLLPDWKGYRSRLASRGFEFTVSYTGEVLGNVSGGSSEGVIYEGVLKPELDFDMERLGAWERGRFHVSALIPHGDSLSGAYLGDLFTLSNIDTEDYARLFEFWYEHQLVPDRFSVRLGLLAADEEFAYTEYGSAFINGTVGWPAILGVQVPAPAYPVATPGLRLAADAGRGWSFQTAVYNGNPYTTDAEGNDHNLHGGELDLQEAFLISELKKEWWVAGNESELPGRAKLGGWYHTGGFEHLRLDDTGLSLADPASSGQPLLLEGSWGLYLAAEQQILAETPETPDQGLGCFARLGGAPGDRHLLELYVEGGLTYTGLLPGRDQDIAGAAVVYGRMSGTLRDLAQENNEFGNGSEPPPDYEMVVEATYRAALRPGLSAQPLAAYVLHPGGLPGNDALVLGLRFLVDF